MDIVRGIGVVQPEDFEGFYKGTPPWDVGKPQPAFEALARQGLIGGRVLDVGCGTGEHALMAAKPGLEAWGIDFVDAAIQRARQKAEQRGLTATFVTGDALKMQALGTTFDTVLDCGLFHVFNDADRALFVESLKSVMRPRAKYFVLAFSDRVPGDAGPRRVKESELRAAFADGFRIASVEMSEIEIVGGGKIPSWLARIERT